MRIITDLKPAIPSIDLLNMRLLGGFGDYLPLFTQNPVEERSSQERDDERRIGRVPQAGNMYVFEWSLL